MLSVLIAGAVCLTGAGKEESSSALVKTARAGDPCRVTGQVYKKEIKSDYQLLYLRENSIEIRKQRLTESKLIIYDKSMKEIKTGNTIYTEGKIDFYEKARNPGNFDQELYYAKMGIYAGVWTENISVAKESTWRLLEGLSRFRQRWKETLYKVLGEKQGAVLCGIMLGDKTGIDPELKERYQLNGIGHILAISGLHLSFIGIGMYTLLRRLTGSYIAGGTGGIAFLILYILMVGVTVSAVRAAVMFLFRVGADISGRHYDGATAFTFAAAVVLLWRPLYIWDGGFWLSFGAVGGVLAVLPLLQKLSRRNRWQGICAGISIQAAVFPVLLYYFFEFPLYALLLNVMVIPLMTVLLSLGIAGSAAVFFAGLPGELILGACQIILTWYEWLCRFAAKLPAARIITGKPPFLSLVFYYASLSGILLVWYCRKSKKIARYMFFTVFMGASAFLILLLPNRMEDRGKLTVTMLDVGQGDGIFIKGPGGQTYFIDGGSSDINQAGKYKIEPFLKSKGVGELDYVFISHGDSDHISGISEMLDRRDLGIRIKHVVMPARKTWDENLMELAAKADRNKAKVLIMEQGQQIQEGELKFQCLYPGGSYEGEPGNAASMVLWISFGQFDMLCTGDVEGEGETTLEEILKGREKTEKLEILKVAHHGSKNSTSEAFLDAANPLYAFISAGQNSRYGHPHKETLERLERKGCGIYTTAEKGAVTVNTDGSRMHISTFVSGKWLN